MKATTVVFIGAALATVATSAPYVPQVTATAYSDTVTATLAASETHTYGASFRYESTTPHYITDGSATANLQLRADATVPIAPGMTALVDITLLYDNEPLAMQTIALAPNEMQNVALQTDVWLRCGSDEITNCTDGISLVISRSDSTTDLAVSYSTAINVTAIYESESTDAQASIEIWRAQ